MVPRWPKRGQGVRAGGVATNVIKGTLFSKFRHPGGYDEAKIYPRWVQSWGREEAKRNPKRSACESKLLCGRGKLGPSRSEDEATMEPECRHHSPKEEERRCQGKANLRRLGNNMGPSRSEDEAKMAPRPEWIRKCITVGVPEPMVKHKFFATRRGGELGKNGAKMGTHGGTVGPQSRPT